MTLGDDARRATIAWSTGAPDLVIAVDAGAIALEPREVPVHYPEEAARGTSPDEILHAPLVIEAALPPGGRVVVVLGTAAGSEAAVPHPDAGPAVIAAAEAHAADLARTVGGDASPPFVAALAVAAERFLVRRFHADTGAPGDDDHRRLPVVRRLGPGHDDRRCPGLALALGRRRGRGEILRTWAALVRDGLLPNHFPEAGGEAAYHAIDAPLWFVHALGAYERATGDASLVRELRGAVEQILGAYRRGTRFGIGDGPRRRPGPRRRARPPAHLDGREGRRRRHHAAPRQAGRDPGAVDRGAQAGRALGGRGRRRGLGRARTPTTRPRAPPPRSATASSGPDLGWLNDVVDGPEGDDGSLRPNQLFALSLLPDLVTRGAGGIDPRCGRAPPRRARAGSGRSRRSSPATAPWFQGPPAFRDSAYHQGPAWTWLLGAWIDAVARFRGRDAARARARGGPSMPSASTGGVAELLEPEPPHAARGCPWQAWGVAELLRCATGG